MRLKARLLRVRRRLGRIYYAWKRRVEWSTGTTKYARNIGPPLAHVIIQHESLLLRPLKGVDMYLQHNKITNLRLAAGSMHGLVIHPGEIFSFWWLVGKPTARRGFLEGLVLENGRVSKGIGGGLCQMGNLIYWMALHSPLSIVERWRHSYDVFPDIGRNLPFGSGATLAWNYIDLQLKNETPAPIQLGIWLSATHLHGELRCVGIPEKRYEIMEKDHQIRLESWGGYSRHNMIIRRTFDVQTNALISEETIAENHALLMYQPFLNA